MGEFEKWMLERMNNDTRIVEEDDAGIVLKGVEEIIRKYEGEK